MKTHPILLASASLAFLASCAGPAGIPVRGVEAVSLNSKAAEGPLQFEMSVRDGLRAAKGHAPEKFKAGDRIRSGAQRDFFYPSSYEAPRVVGNSVTPSTPKDLKKIKTGLVADLATRRVGGAVLIEGTVTITEFQGFTRMEGVFGRPLLDSKERLVTENRIEMPKIATYTTPVCVAIRPGDSSSFEVSAPKKGTRVTFSISPNVGG